MGVTEADLERTLQELETYREELETQNEELRAIQQELVESRNRYYELYDLAPVAYCTLRADGFVSEINLAGAEMLGLERSVLRSLPFDRFIAPDSVVEYHRFKTEVLRSGVKKRCEVSLFRRDRDKLDVQLEGVAVSSASGGIRLTMTDITGLKNAQREINRLNESLQRHLRELKRSNTDLEQFAYVVSHDLREPLRMITGFIRLFSEHYREAVDDRGREYITFIVEGAERMQRLIHDLLQYSRVGTLGQEPAVVDLERVLDQALANAQTMIEESGAVVRREPLPVVKGEELQLVQVFQNLIVNAIRYSHPDRRPEIEVGARGEDNHWRLWVKDNGIGIDKRFFKKIFLIFQQLNRDGPGTGIGLAVCKKIVERHGGRIWVESTPEEGSIFYFTLPSWRE